MIPQVVLIDLDVLLDTRLAVAEQLGATDIDWDGYLTRTHSKVWEFFGIPEKDYLKAYANRNTSTLDYCSNKATIMCKQLEYIFRNKFLLASSSPMHERPMLCINVWPYQLKEAECAEIANSVLEFFSEKRNIAVTTIYTPKANLKPKDIKGVYCDYILYDLTEWLTHASHDFAETPIPDITIVHPATLNTEDISKYKPSSSSDNPFNSMRMMTKLVVDLVAVEPSLYSVDPSLLWPHDQSR